MERGSFGDHLSLGSVVFFKVREGGREGGEGCCCTYDFIYVYSIYTMVV
jgi:hypothetical protein